MKYNLKITEEQADIIVKSLDLLSRIHMHQIEEVTKILRYAVGGCNDWNGNKIPYDKLNELEDKILNLKPLIGDPPNGSHGIHSHHIDEVARKAWDMQQTIRHRLAWDREGKDPDVDERTSEMFGVHYDTPMRTTTDPKFKFPEIEKE